MVDAATLQRVCLTPRLEGVGGMVSFQHKLAAGLERRGIAVSYDLDDLPYQAVLVIGGTRRLGKLWRARRRGIPIVQRLDGMNWLHRIPVSGGRSAAKIRHTLRAEAANWLLAFTRNRLATWVVYQSQFSRNWWERVYGRAPVPDSVIYNGVDLEEYIPHGKQDRPGDHWRVLLVEGSLMGGYEISLSVAMSFTESLSDRLGSQGLGEVELMVAGRVSPEVQQKVSESARVRLAWAGLLPRSRIPELDRSAHLLYAADINAACPNSVIEALACGLPVVSFDTGALPELVEGDAGRIAAYGGDPWKLDPPDVAGLAKAAEAVLADQERFRSGARHRAETLFGLEAMVDGYVRALQGG